MISKSFFNMWGWTAIVVGVVLVLGLIALANADNNDDEPDREL